MSKLIRPIQIPPTIIRPLSSPIKNLEMTPDNYVTDDNRQNLYFTDDAQQNNYLWKDTS